MVLEENVVCGKCNTQMICRVCTSGHQSSPQAGPNTGEKQSGLSTGEKQPGLNVGEKQPGLSVGEKITCSKCSMPLHFESIMCNDCSGCSKYGVKKDEGN